MAQRQQHAFYDINADEAQVIICWNYINVSRYAKIFQMVNCNKEM